MAKSKKPHQTHINRLLEKRKQHLARLNPTQLTKAILNGDKGALSETITLIESTKAKQNEIGQNVLNNCLKHTGKSIRIGITGVPGVGKSTFIEAFGTYLAEQGKKVAVLAIDPSSEVSQGSILGDKTRMVDLSTHPNAFIRPTATSGSLGGVARKTREAILLCEAAGFDIILVETVGVGQSETEVHSMTDFFLLLMLAGAGDELQGIKRGIMEMADTIIITKTDGENVKMANLARTEYKNALHLFPPKQNEWIPKVETVSSLENKGIEKIWAIIQSFELLVKSNGWKQKKRKSQQIYWMNEDVKNILLNDFYSTTGIADEIEQITQKLNAEQLTSYQAASAIITYYNNEKRNI